ncbi:unnamed protein product, partial [Iphiclides podalirius]
MRTFIAVGRDAARFAFLAWRASHRRTVRSYLTHDKPGRFRASDNLANNDGAPPQIHTMSPDSAVAVSRARAAAASANKSPGFPPISRRPAASGAPAAASYKLPTRPRHKSHNGRRKCVYYCLNTRRDVDSVAAPMTDAPTAAVSGGLNYCAFERLGLEVGVANCYFPD